MNASNAGKLEALPRPELLTTMARQLDALISEIADIMHVDGADQKRPLFEELPGNIVVLNDFPDPDTAMLEAAKLRLEEALYLVGCCSHEA
jgi:hypothetical protein